VNLIVNMSIAVVQSVIGVKKTVRMICMKIRLKRMQRQKVLDKVRDKMALEVTGRFTHFSEKVEFSYMVLLENRSEISLLDISQVSHGLNLSEAIEEPAFEVLKT
jgi:hypothetical protein